MSDIAQQNLQEPEPINWDLYNGGGSKFVAPPPARDASGKPIVYYGIPEKVEEETVRPATDDETGQPLLTFNLDPLKIVKSGAADGYTIRFTRVSTKQRKRNGKAINASSIGDYLRACGLTGVKPNTNQEYRAAMKIASPKVFGFTLDWTGYSKDTGERVEGFYAFPEDPERPGQRKAILKKGDIYFVTDRKGNVVETKTVEADVIFANARLLFFKDPTREVK